MKCIIRNGDYQRVDNETAEIRVKTQSWKYINKIEWKKNFRDVSKSISVTDITNDSKHKKTKEKRAEKHINLKNKQKN